MDDDPTVTVGMVVEDCDPRRGARRGVIRRIFVRTYRHGAPDRIAVIDWPRGLGYIRTSRIHTKGIRSGYRVVETPESK